MWNLRGANNPWGFWKWLAGMMEDQKGSTSSKRAVLFFICYTFYMQVRESFVPGSNFNSTIFAWTCVLILFFGGFITTEIVMAYFNKEKPSVKDPLALGEISDQLKKG